MSSEDELLGYITGIEDIFSFPDEGVHVTTTAKRKKMKRARQYSLDNFQHSLSFNTGSDQVEWLQPAQGLCFSFHDHSIENVVEWIKNAWGCEDSSLRTSYNGGKGLNIFVDGNYYTPSRVVYFRKLDRKDVRVWYVKYAGFLKDCPTEFLSNTGSSTSHHRRSTSQSRGGEISMTCHDVSNIAPPSPVCSSGSSGVDIQSPAPLHAKIDKKTAQHYIANIQFLLDAVAAGRFMVAFRCSVNMMMESKEKTSDLFRICLGWKENPRCTPEYVKLPANHSSHESLEDFGAFTIEDRDDDFLYSYRFALYRYQHVYICAIGDKELQKRVLMTKEDSELSNINPVWRCDDEALREADEAIHAAGSEEKLRSDAKLFLMYHLNEGMIPKCSSGNL